MSIAEKLTTIAENQQAVYEAGKQAEYDRFWDAYQYARKEYKYAFAGCGWNAKTFKPKYDIRPTAANYMFASHSTDTGIYNLAVHLANQNVSIDFSQCTNMAYCFYQAFINRIGTIDLSSANDVTSVFNSSYLVTIYTLIPPPVSMSASCWQTNLEDLTIGGPITKDLNLSRCGKLTAESVQSIIDHLADLTGQTAQTLTFHATVGGKLTDEQKAIITARNWILVY